MISLHRATAADSASVFEWRNDVDTRAASISQAQVSWTDHERWFAGVLTDPSRYLYIGWVGPDRVGLCRFDADLAGGSAEVSINVNPAHRGQGHAVGLLRSAIDRFREDAKPGIRITATIRPENSASLRTFAALGFVPSGSEQGLDHFVLDI